MATSELPTPTLQPLQPLAGDKPLLAVIDDAASCCGGSCSLG
jgi:hypothetical protein